MDSANIHTNQKGLLASDKTPAPAGTWIEALGKAMVFPVVMYGCESWTIKKAEHQRIDAFEL